MRVQRTPLDMVVDEAAGQVLEASDGDTAAGLYAPIVAAALRHLLAEHAENSVEELEACFNLDRETAEPLVALGPEALNDPERVDIVEILSDYLCTEDAFNGFEGRVFDGSFLVAGYDSSSSAVMTAGSSTVMGVQWRERVFFREIGGEDAAFDIDGYRFAYHAGDEEERRTAVLGIIEEIGSLGPGGYLGDELEMEFGAEIRRVTEQNSDYAEWLRDSIERLEELDFDFLKEHVQEYSDLHDLPESEAESVLDRLTQDLEPRSQAERDALWRIWLDIRSE